MTLKIDNRLARRLWLNTTGLSKNPTGTINVLDIIKSLGFVQLDTIQNVSRAHHHIIWSRNQNYAEPMLDELLKSKQYIFEHFTHDASVIPIEFYPMWTRQFGRLKKWLDSTKRYSSLLREVDLPAIKARIKNEGPLSTHAFDTKINGKKKMWSRPPHKIALDYMWYSGELATSHREKFKKYYDLSQRVIPKDIRDKVITDNDQINWLCHSALNRLSFGSLKDIQKFWDATSLKEVEEWSKKAKGQLIKILWQAKDGQWHSGYAPHDMEQRIETLTRPTSRLRIINPFDPAIRDRARLQHIFGFDYKIEIFVPAQRREWGYYVYPILEGEHFVGRIELKADRKSGLLNVINFWPEINIKWGKVRRDKLDKELARLAKFANLTHFNWLQQS